MSEAMIGFVTVFCGLCTYNIHQSHVQFQVSVCYIVATLAYIQMCCDSAYISK